MVKGNTMTLNIYNNHVITGSYDSYNLDPTLADNQSIASKEAIAGGTQACAIKDTDINANTVMRDGSVNDDIVTREELDEQVNQSIIGRLAEGLDVFERQKAEANELEARKKENKNNALDELDNENDLENLAELFGSFKM